MGGYQVAQDFPQRREAVLVDPLIERLALGRHFGLGE